jgi:ligand-binding SRPBCC domain-containing protein
MKIKIATQVKSEWKKVVSGFTKELFVKLNPPFPPVVVKQFDGCIKGDKVVLELNFLLFKQEWVSDIIESVEDENGFSFIDVGVKLPFFLSRWRHHHIIKKREDGGTTIIDDIDFSTGSLLTDLLFYPILYGQFLYRKPIYRKIFSR